MRAISWFRSTTLSRSLSMPSMQLFPALHKSFSTSPFLQSVSADLVNQLSKEIEFETENAPKDPDLIKEFKAKSGWIINDELGKKEVMMTKTFGTDNVKVYFNTSMAHSEEVCALTNG